MQHMLRYLSSQSTIARRPFRAIFPVLKPGRHLSRQPPRCIRRCQF